MDWDGFTTPGGSDTKSATEAHCGRSNYLTQEKFAEAPFTMRFVPLFEQHESRSSF